MLKEQRRQYILDQLNKAKALNINQVSQELNVSYMTIWRDLTDLESHGLLQRVRGGAVAAKRDADHEKIPFLNFDPSQDPNYAKKIAIGRYSANHLVENGDNITIEAGTTASAMAPFLTNKDLTVLTNGLVTALTLARRLPHITVMCSGGILIETGAFIGPQVQEFFKHFHVNKAFLSAQGLTLEDGFTDPTPLYSDLKTVMKANAEKIIVLLDSSKLGNRSLIQVLHLEDVHILVTDAYADPNMLEEIRSHGIDVRIADHDL
jgi:DeoR/GlpR family transcriptional regulator of sugar metabolism